MYNTDTEYRLTKMMEAFVYRFTLDSFLRNEILFDFYSLGSISVCLLSKETFFFVIGSINSMDLASNCRGWL